MLSGTSSAIWEELAQAASPSEVLPMTAPAPSVIPPRASVAPPLPRTVTPPDPISPDRPPLAEARPLVPAQAAPSDVQSASATNTRNRPPAMARPPLARYYAPRGSTFITVLGCGASSTTTDATRRPARLRKSFRILWQTGTWGSRRTTAEMCVSIQSSARGLMTSLSPHRDVREGPQTDGWFADER